MAWKDIPLPQLTYRSSEDVELPSSLGARIVDMYISELGTYRKRPGLVEFANLGTADKVDGIWWWDNKGFPLVVSGAKVFKLGQDGSVTDLTGDAPLLRKIPTFTDDGTQALIANGGRMLTTNGIAATAYIADADAPTEVTHVAYLDGYALANKVGTRRFFFSDPDDITSWGALDFFAAEGDPDFLTALHVARREISLYGDESDEMWYNDGSSPFSRFETGFIQTGVRAVDTIKEISGSYIFLDDEIRFVMVEGRRVRNISGPFDDVFRSLSSPGDARAMIMHIGNRAFYVVNFDADNRTFCYDLSTEQWAEWGKWTSAQGDYTKFIGQTHTFAKAWNKHLVGHVSNGKIYEISFDHEDDAGDTIRSVLRTAPNTYGKYVRKKSKALRFRILRGLGSGSDHPKFNMRYRDDGGPWSNEVQVDLGKIGENEYFTRLNKLGMYRSRQWEFIHTYGTDFQLVNIEEDVEFMRH
jgi:hypothetical protein